MSIYRYEVVTAGNVERVNQLLVRGWKPSREMPLETAARAGELPAALVVLERADTAPIAPTAQLAGGIPVSLLNEVPLLDGLTHEELAELAGCGEIRRYAADDVIFEQGSQNACLCIILNGDIELRLPSAGVGGAHIMQIGERDVFGESSFFSGGSHAAEATAVNDVELLAIPRAGFDELLQASRPVAWKIAMNAAGILGVRLQETDDWLSELLQQEEDARIAQSWHRFRESAGRGGFTAHPFFGT
ncbi:cyclic nucleotide-binding domain-containing protein [bacterium]|nr:cyclic nucleotide-binding domain-containing protein [bacterium]